MRNYANYPASINVLFKILKNIEGKIIRDFGELEYLQNSKNPPKNFALKLHSAIYDQIIDKIQYLEPDFGIICNGQKVSDATDNNYFIINTLDGEENITRALPFFTTSIAMSEKHDEEYQIYAAIISNPILQHSFWAEEQKGAFANNKKMRVSNNSIPEEILIAGKEGINLNCPSLELCYLASGKFDAASYQYKNRFQFSALEFIVKLAGGRVIVDETKKTIYFANSFFIKKYETED